MKMPLAGVIALTLCCSFSFGQPPSKETRDPQITGVFVHATIASLKTLIREKYFDTSYIPRIEAALASSEQHGDYAKADTLGILSTELTNTLYESSHDKHLFVLATETPKSHSTASSLSRTERAGMENYGMKRAEILDGNIGYLQIMAFYHADEGAPALEAAMNFVSHTDALILDLRNNGGGSPDTAIQLLSYFFKQPNLPLLSILPRFGDTTIYSTQTAAVSYRDESRPLYVLVSGSSWSAGEAVPFVLQERHRAIIIGEKTAGAANPASPWPINSALSVTIPFGHIESAVRRTNWEGTGVIPDIVVSPSRALDVAHVKALETLMSSTTDSVKKQVLSHALATAKTK